MRNKVCHIAPKDKVEDIDFQTFCSETITCFKNLDLSTSALEAIAKEQSFDTNEVVRMRAELAREEMTISEYEQYFCQKLSSLRKDFNPRPYLGKLKGLGIPSEREVENIKKQMKRQVKLAMVIDSVVYKGTEAVALAFLNFLSETDPEIASSFMNFLAPSKQMEEICNYAPKKIHRATVKYPKLYKSVM